MAKEYISSAIKIGMLQFFDNNIEKTIFERDEKE